MNPQGSSLINTDYFDSLIETANNIQTCEELRKLKTEALESIAALQAGIASEAAALAPILALLTAPGANLGQIVTWITSLINNVLTPMYKPTITYAAQLAAFPAKIAELTAAFEAAADRIPNCSL